MALRAINGSSGRSLQTQERLPQAVLTRNFDYGFKLGLMLKDVDIALSDVRPLLCTHAYNILAARSDAILTIMPCYPGSAAARGRGSRSTGE